MRRWGHDPTLRWPAQQIGICQVMREKPGFSNGLWLQEWKKYGILEVNYKE